MRLGKLLLTWMALLCFCVPRSQAQTVTVSWNNLDQLVDGFGVSSYAPTAVLTAAQAAFFFSTGPGALGLSLMRTFIPVDGSCATVNAACAGGPNSGDTPLAIANGVKVWSTALSPPASMKTNGSVDCTAGSGNGALSPGSYSAYADYLANYVRSFKSLYGTNLYAISVQNEPDGCQSYSSTLWTAAQLNTFIRINLGPTLASAGLSSTLMMMPESSHYASFATLAGATMDDPVAAAYVGINAWHDYDDAPSAPNPYAAQNKLYWETEASAGIGTDGKEFGPSLCGGCWDPSIQDALMWAQIVDNRMSVANANAWHWFVTIGPNNANEGLATIGSPTVVSKRAYMLGNYSKFVRPGFHRIDATHTPQSGVLVSAYKNASTGALVIVVVNQNTSGVSQSFTLQGATVPSLTPWVTSASLNLAEQSDVYVGGGSFTYTLPASSITSFVGTATAVGAIVAPTNLKAMAQ
jgi:glucuronoarabinoxylan endo-1,4-beta-xylanase